MFCTRSDWKSPWTLHTGAIGNDWLCESELLQRRKSLKYFFTLIKSKSLLLLQLCDHVGEGAFFFFFVKLPSQLTTRLMRAAREFVQHIRKCNRLGNFLECILSLLNCSHFPFLATLGILYHQCSLCFHHLWNLSSACPCNYYSKTFEAWCWSLRHLPPSPQNDVMSSALHSSFRIVHVVSWYGFAYLFFVHKILPLPVAIVKRRAHSLKHACFCLSA